MSSQASSSRDSGRYIEGSVSRLPTDNSIQAPNGQDPSCFRVLSLLREFINFLVAGSFTLLKLSEDIHESFCLYGLSLPIFTIMES